MADPHEEVGPNNADENPSEGDGAQGTERSEIERLQTELADAQERVLRAQAETENLRNHKISRHRLKQNPQEELYEVSPERGRGSR